MGEAIGEAIRNRVVEVIQVEPGELLDNKGNWRRHSNGQRNAMRGVLQEIGIAAPLIAYRSEREGGKLTLIDGHMRKKDFADQTWPVAVTDLTDAEADLLLQAYDPIGSMAMADKSALDALRSKGEFLDTSVRVMLDSIQHGVPVAPDTEGSGAAVAAATEKGATAGGATEDTIPEMELQPYEHYDYVLVLARNVMDWNYLVERLGLKRVNGSTDPRYKKVGLGRAISADKLIEVLRQADEALGRV